MEKTSPATSFADRMVRIVPSGFSLLFVIGLLLVARYYDFFPVRPAPCGLRTLTGVPCLGCGGTRAMMALSRGEFLQAISFNPLVIVGVLGVILWFVVALWRTITGAEHRRRKGIQTRWMVTGIVILAVANWVYLCLSLPD